MDFCIYLSLPCFHIGIKLDDMTLFCSVVLGVVKEVNTGLVLVLIPFSGIDTFYLVSISILKNRYVSILSFDTDLRYQYQSIDTSLRFFSIPSKYL